MLDITVCIMSYNRPQYLREALLSVLHQSQKPQKVVIYDNGSEEAVYKAVADLLNKDIHFISTDINKGVIWNLERAIASTNTKYTMLFHDDDILYENFLAIQIGILEENDNLIALSSNAKIIDKDGVKKNFSLLTINRNNPIEIYKSSGDVAMKYASNSCIPLSPTIYKTANLRNLTLRKEFDKVLDAVIFCDLADNGWIGCNTTANFYLRVHGNQDSTIFPYDLLEKLEGFFWTRKCSSENMQKKLHKKLLIQHTIRNIRAAYFALQEKDYAKFKKLLFDKKNFTLNLFNVLFSRLPIQLVRLLLRNKNSLINELRKK